MIKNWIVLTLLILKMASLNSYSLVDDDNVIMNEFVVKIYGGFSEALRVAKQTGFILHHKMMGFDDLYVFNYNQKSRNVSNFLQHRVRRSSKVQFMDQQVAKKRVKRNVLPNQESYTFNDPLYKDQWYLIRSQFNPRLFDMNVLEAWNLGFSGKNVVVSILDDGIDYRHPDIKDNYDPRASYDINGGDSDPLPNDQILDNRHGTRCAGEVSAKANNNICGVGIAYNSKIGGVRMLDGEVNDRVEAEALSLNRQHIDIYSGSWGPDDNGQKLEGPAKLAKRAIIRGVKEGRQGLGNIYVWASGNGGSKGDSCACDGYASSIYTLSVSSVSEHNLKPWYLESCASTLISTYSSGGPDERKIVSVDLHGKCTSEHTGTSASAPLAAGIVALVLEANRNLTWRDIQYLTVLTANTLPFSEADFFINGANRKVSNLYGFGLMDAGKMVRLGQLWQTLPPQHMCRINSAQVNRNLSGEFIEQLSVISNGCVQNNAVNYVEHVMLYLSIEYQRRGDLQIFLISPAKTRSEILPFRKYDFHSGNATFDKWPLMSIQFWGEKCAGTWTLEIRNMKSNIATMKGFLRSFSVQFYGTDKWPIKLNPPKEKDDWFQQFERFVVPYINESEFNLSKHIPKLTNSSATANFECSWQNSSNPCFGASSLAYNGGCGRTCFSGTFLNSTSQTCQSCHYTCDECTAGGKYNCSRCHLKDSFDHVKNVCKMSENSCPKGYFKGPNHCEKCSDNCSICTSPLECSQCKDGMVLSLNSFCGTECDIGSYADPRGRCRVCHGDCLTCTNGNINECTSCSKGSFILPLYNDINYGRCVPKCDPEFYTNNITGVCYRCHEDCKTCTGPARNQCTDCIPPLIMSTTNATCYDPASFNCKPDQFKSAKGVCESCPEHCQSCDSSRCTSCRSNRIMNNNACVEQCPRDSIFDEEVNTCLPCTILCDSCKENVTLGRCSQCSRKDTNCSRKCDLGNYWNLSNSSCSSCHPSCSECDGSGHDNCINCSRHNTFLWLRQCFKSCPPNHYSHRDICIPCHYSCKDSSCDKDTGKCLQCPDGHQLSHTGRCERIITCPKSQFWNSTDMSCQQCNMTCRSCTKQAFCTSCHKNHCLHPTYGTCNPCCSQFCTTKNCYQCVAGREFCKLSYSKFHSTDLIPFQNAILIAFLVFPLVLFVFVAIMTVMYKGEILEATRNKYSKKSSIKYAMVKIEDEDDTVNSEDNSVDSKHPLLSKSTIPTDSHNNRRSHF